MQLYDLSRRPPQSTSLADREHRLRIRCEWRARILHRRCSSQLVFYLEGESCSRRPRALHVDAALREGGVLDLRREAMRDRVTKDAKADWRIDITRRFSPIFEVSERVTLCRSFLFLHSAEHCRYSDP